MKKQENTPKVKQPDLEEKEFIAPAVDLKNGRRLILAVSSRVVDPNTSKKTHILRVGWSVKNPEDVKINDELGTIIAKGRVKSPVFSLLVRGQRVSKTLMESIAKLVQDEFEHRLGNYVPLPKDKSADKPGSKRPTRATKPAASTRKTGSTKSTVQQKQAAVEPS